MVKGIWEVSSIVGRILDIADYDIVHTIPSAVEDTKIDAVF